MVAPVVWFGFAFILSCEKDYMVYVLIGALSELSQITLNSWKQIADILLQL